MNFLSTVKGKLIVSCQALPDEPLHSSFIMGRMALAAKEGGAKAIRAQSSVDIQEIKKVTNLPVIGLVKLVARLSKELAIPVFAEGRINVPEDISRVMAAGAYAPIVGSAITRPQLITAKFAQKLGNS